MKLFLVVDMQEGFATNHDMKLTSNRAAQFIASLPDCDRIITTRFVNKDDSIFERFIGWSEMKDAESCKFLPGIADKACYVYDKTAYACDGADYNTLLDALISANDCIKPREVYVFGFDTDCCVLALATALFDMGIKPIVLSDLCDSSGGKKQHEAGLMCLSRLIGKKNIIDSSDIEE